ncbi:Lrp/AsnC family transcriptional regulator [Candidatus Woesearchaeota archaeon]|nr:Lrp/AsnC family transcriptional regulator [Candidatus Woesearchaeota archaeon]
MELNEKEKKLLAYLYHSDREPLTKIARKTNLTRMQVEYAFKKLIKEGIVEKFIPMFNYGAFGYHVYALLFIKLEKYSSFGSFTKRLEQSNSCISWGECFGKYDLYTNLIFKSEEEMSNFLSGLTNKKDEPILDYLFIKPYIAEFHPLKLFYEKHKPIFSIIPSTTIEIKLDKKDREILKILEKDSRISIVEISKKVEISAELTLYKIKKFYKEKIIFGSRAMVKMKKLGYNYSMLLFSVKNLSNETKEKIINFARKEKSVNALVLSLFNPNCLIQIFHETEDELKGEVRKIKELLKDEIFDLDIILAQEEDKVNTLPFLE